jgi:hypothetical protein
MSEDDSNGSSDTEDAQAAPNPKQVRLASQAQEHDRISTLRSFVQQWREYSAKSRENRQELNARNERAEKIANDITLGARFSNHGGDFLSAPTKKRITIEADATQMFIMAEEVSSWLSARVIVQSEGSLRKLVTNKGYGPQRHLPVFCLNWPSEEIRERISLLAGKYGHLSSQEVLRPQNGWRSSWQETKRHQIYLA